MDDDGPRRGQNPWLEIPVSDYEGHMGSSEVGQSPVLNQIFADTLAEFSPQHLLIIGCAAGNGFEHVDPNLIRRIVGVDINPDYLETLKERYGARIPNLELVCSDLIRCSFERGSFDLIHAALIFEYLRPGDVLPKLVRWLKPGGVLAVVLQRPSQTSKEVSETPYTSLKALESIMRLVDPAVLRNLANKSGLQEVRSREVELKLGKKFCVAYYQKDNGEAWQVAHDRGWSNPTVTEP
jgi:SAM-dependent methyltransferase